jgi:hypothetical protein
MVYSNGCIGNTLVQAEYKNIPPVAIDIIISINLKTMRIIYAANVANEMVL